MTTVGNLSRDNAQKLLEFVSVEPQIRPWDILQTKFKAKALQEKVYIKCDKVKADTWDRRNMRIEFNPNKLTHEEMLWLKRNIIDYMEDDGSIRLDLVFDSKDDLSDYYTMTNKSVKKVTSYGRNGKPEIKYFGVRDSDGFIRIYNRKQECKDNTDIEVMSEHLWCVKIKLRRNTVDYWNDYFDDLHILKPGYSTIEKALDRHTIVVSPFDENEWGELERKKKCRMKKLMIETPPVDLTELIRSTLRESEK